MMSALQMTQLAAGLLAVATPWIVVWIATAAACRHAPATRRRTPSQRRIARATLLLMPVVSGFALWLPPLSGWMALVDLGAFALLAALALRALHDLDVVTRSSREIATPIRHARLAARRSGQYVSWWWRSLPSGALGAGLGLLVWRLLAEAPGDRRLFVPVSFALGAAIFCWLYEVWVHALVAGPVMAGADDDERERGRLIRLVIAVECVLVGACLVVAHVLLDLDWVARGAVGGAVALAGGLVGVLGCALALASDLVVRRFQPHAG